ncbi:MAG: EscU/YscU/HrcU family type III secretion system export apparatus switch protein [Gammaproteobacteria bacterium]|nr:EscU/YscU/HrcU family type III secretion system export apparatus switch protein [Gammaproteobacteria bacterium]
MNTEPSEKRAVALQYDAPAAPRITASGEGDIAEEILRLAQEAGVHVHEDAQLAQLLGRLELGTEIPRELYLAIAEIIAFAYMLKGKFPVGKTAQDYASES